MLKGYRSGEYHDCLICKKRFYVFPRDLKKGRGKYCSQKCKSLSQVGVPSKTRKGTREICLICNRKFYVPKWWKNKEAKFCSRKCYWQSKIGKHPWNYEGKTPINEAIRKTRVYRKWARQIKKRDDYTCQMCRKRGGILHSDHIKPFAYFPELRFELTNGRTLCISCHRLTDTYGNNIKNYKFLNI